MLPHFKYAKDLLLDRSITITEGYQQQVFSLLRDKPFYIWDREQHDKEYNQTGGLCCFNDIVGRPTKGEREYELFDYEKIIYDSLMIPEYNNPLNHDFKDKHLYVLKSHWVRTVHSGTEVDGMASTKE